MKVGMIFECGPDGPDEKVCKHFASIVAPGVEIVPRTMNDKGQLLEGVAKVVKALLEVSLCSRVVVVWDSKPGATREEECRQLKTSLEEEHLPLDRVHLVCITEMLEAWLIADSDAVETIACRPTHRVRFSCASDVASVQDPKSLLKSFFEENLGRRNTYRDYQHAIKIARAMDNGLTPLRRVCSFQRFAARLNAT